jgi:hypothetical protein
MVRDRVHPGVFAAAVVAASEVKLVPESYNSTSLAEKESGSGLMTYKSFMG